MAKEGRVGSKILIALFLLILIGLILDRTGASNNQSLVTTPQTNLTDTQSQPSQIAEDLSWVPSGYSLSDDHKVAYRWKAVDFCDPYICWKWSFISNEGCPNDFYAAINFLDKNNAVIGYTNATLPSLQPLQTAILTFQEPTDDGGKNADISQIQCL